MRVAREPEAERMHPPHVGLIERAERLAVAGLGQSDEVSHRLGGGGRPNRLEDASSGHQGESGHVNGMPAGALGFTWRSGGQADS